MIPLRDSVPASRRPVVNWCLIALCLAAFLLQLGEDRQGAAFTERLAMIPARVSEPDRPLSIVVGVEPVRTWNGTELRPVRRQPAPPPFPAWLTLLTCIFLHGGFVHFLGNMWFLWIFGDNVEDRFGRLGYLLFYLACGVGASLAHWLTDPTSTVPVVGASGAIAGVMGAYLLLYPRSQVLALVPLGMILTTVVLPAPLFLGLWFVIQLFQGTLSLGAVTTGGVAWWAHIGGFALGFATAALLRAAERLRPAPPGIVLARQRRGGWSDD